MKRKTTRLLIGAFLTAALMVSATYAFANAPNPTATANISTTITHTSGDCFISTDSQNTIVGALTALTEGGALVGTELAAIVNTAFANQIRVALNNSSTQVAINNDAAPTFTERTRGDAIYHLQSAANANNTAKAAPDIDEGAEYEFIFEIAGANITGFAHLTG